MLSRRLCKWTNEWTSWKSLSLTYSHPHSQSFVKIFIRFSLGLRLLCSVCVCDGFIIIRLNWQRLLTSILENTYKIFPIPFISHPCDRLWCKRFKIEICATLSILTYKTPLLHSCQHYGRSTYSKSSSSSSNNPTKHPAPVSSSLPSPPPSSPSPNH